MRGERLGVGTFRAASEENTKVIISRNNIIDLSLWRDWRDLRE